MSVLESIKEHLQWGQSVGEKVERAEIIERRLPELDRALAHERGALVPLDELAKRAQAWIADLARQYGTTTTGPYSTAIVAMDVLRPLASWNTPTPPHVRPEGLLPFLAWVLAPQLKAGIADEDKFKALPEYVAGSKSDERPARIATLEQERAALVAEHERLVDEASRESNGKVVVAHLKETADRRETERFRREREEQAVADRQRREAAVNQRHEQGRGVVASPYLQHGGRLLR